MPSPSNDNIFSSLLKLALGVGTVLVGAYAFSKYKDKLKLDERIEKLEELIKGLTGKKTPLEDQ